MFCIQVWDDTQKKYFSALVKGADTGYVTGHEIPGEGVVPTLYEDGVQALQDAEDVANFSRGVTCVLDLTTGNRHFNEDSLPE